MAPQLKIVKTNWSDDGQTEATFTHGETKFRVRGGGYPLIQAYVGGDWYSVGRSSPEYDGRISRCLDWKNESWKHIPGTEDTLAVGSMWDEIVAKCDAIARRGERAEDNSTYYTKW